MKRPDRTGARRVPQSGHKPAASAAAFAPLGLQSLDVQLALLGHVPERRGDLLVGDIVEQPTAARDPLAQIVDAIIAHELFLLRRGALLNQQ